MEGEGKQIHVVMLTVPVAGHTNPMLQASLQLASKGVKVTFVNSENNKSLMEKHPLLQFPASSSAGMEDDAENSKPYTNNISFLYVSDGLHPEHVLTMSRMEINKTRDACYGPACEKLMQTLVLQEPPVTCIISCIGISHVQDAARRLQLPYVSFWAQSAASYALLLMLGKGKRPPKDALPSDVVPDEMLAPGIPLIKYKEFSLLLAEADGLLINTFEELEAETIGFLKGEGHSIMTVGPLLPESFLSTEGRAASENREQQCCPLRWLDKQQAESVMYVSFGTMIEISTEQIGEIAMGLEASKQAFLWVVKQGQTKGLPEGFLERTSQQGLVIPWAPQLSVLRHPAVGSFLTHCGWNSTLEGMSAGVPLLCWPGMFDQPLNARFAVDKWQVGLNLERAENPAGLVLRTEIERKVVALTQSDSGKALRANAMKWRASAVKAASHTDGSSVINFQRFVQWCKTN